ncbi:MAG: DUF1549 and DUF1553 domain-containing protein [Gemmataceae bacterium]|nr:DUF1549 and DUF1553 domain-containing protein [Gemmataceae bacterium]
MNRTHWSRLIAVCLLGVLGSECPAAPVAKLAVYPPDVRLATSRDRATFVVQWTEPDGITRDITAEAQIDWANDKLVNRIGNVLTPAADGQTTMTVRHGGQSVVVPVIVTQAAADRPISFKLDVMPVFMRAGCNAGSCHGAARGKDGFRLSLFGFDADGDFHRLTREQPGRRLNLAFPDESALLEKAAGKVPHTGGEKFREGDEYYAAIRRWIEAGTPNDPATLPTPVALDVYPRSMVLNGTGASQRMVVRATYSDGTVRDVTRLALFLTNNDVTAKINPDGVVTAGNRGEAFVMARFATFTVGSQVMVLPKDLKFTWPEVQEFNYIDGLVHDKLKKLRITPSEVCTDEVFLRRVTIDITGLLPTVEEYDRFMADPSPDKRAKLVDELLSRKEFAELWVLKWAELLQVRSGDQVSPKAMVLYFNWLQDKIARNVPTNEWVAELLSASGGTFDNPATNYYQTERDRLKVTENVAQVFMGMRIQCAQCHNHPFDRWTMNDYYGFVSFFSQIGRKPGDDPRELIVFNTGGGETRHPVTGQVMKPKFLGGDVADVAGKDRRGVLANWLASDKNPYFAMNLANIVWAHFFGQGIIHEVDDVRVSNPASNPELLAEMGRKFTEYKYDFKRIVRDICLSRTYQLATQTNPSNEADTRNFAHGAIRRIRAESMLDVLLQVTETKEKFPGLPLGARAVEIGDGARSTYFLTTFGRASRETVCSCEVKLEPTLSQSLHLLNGRTTTDKIAQGAVVAKMLREKKSPEAIVENLYLRCLSRKPTPAELDRLKAIIGAEKDQRKVLEDVFWALLNTREFMFNH